MQIRTDSQDYLSDLLRVAIATSWRTKADIARDAQIAPESLSRWLHGRQGLRLSVANRLFAAASQPLRRPSGPL